MSASECSAGGAGALTFDVTGFGPAAAFCSVALDGAVASANRCTAGAAPGVACGVGGAEGTPARAAAAWMVATIACCELTGIAEPVEGGGLPVGALDNGRVMVGKGEPASR